MAGLINKAKEMLGGDKSHNTTDTTHDTTTHGTTHGTHSGRDTIGSRVDPDPGTYGNQGSTTGFGGDDTSGPHRSDLANKADPRIDSDRDGSNTTRGTTGYGVHDTSGPHRSDLANKADPRIDSDRDGSSGTYGTTGGYSGQDTSGPHRSDLLNKADPRVDSDRDGSSATYGSSGTTDSSTGIGAAFGHGSGHHVTRTAELLDPHVDLGSTSSTGLSSGTGSITRTDRDTRDVGTTGYGSSTTGSGLGDTTGYGNDSYGTGRSSNTAGPHSSDVGNKLDPRVDSDLDGRKGYGQRDSLDARQNPPSVMKEHLGHPTDEQGQMSDYGRRHSTKPIEDIRNYGGGHQ